MTKLEKTEKRWKQGLYDAANYLEAELQNSNYTEDVKVEDTQYTFSIEENKLKEDIDVSTLSRTEAEQLMTLDAETDQEIYDNWTNYASNGSELQIGCLEFNGWIGNYFGDMEAQLNAKKNGGRVEVYWEVNTGAASLDQENNPETVKAVSNIEDTLESTLKGKRSKLQRNTQRDQTEQNLDPVYRALAQD